MADVALAVRAEEDRGADGRITVLDPACGVGGLLLAVGEGMAERSADADPGTTALIGTELDSVLAALAEVRLASPTRRGEAAL